MSDTDDSMMDNVILMTSIGHCIVQWASVELHLGLLFHAVHGAPRAATDLIWSRIRSFDAKMQVLHDAVSVSTIETLDRRDWNLLRDHTLKLYGKRNQVAHSTPITLKDGTGALEAFSQIYAPALNPLVPADLERFGLEFFELAETLKRLNLLLRAEKQHQQSTALETDLIHRLRKSDDQKREAQRHRAEAWRQYLARNPDLKF